MAVFGVRNLEVPDTMKPMLTEDPLLGNKVSQSDEVVPTMVPPLEGMEASQFQVFVTVLYAELVMVSVQGEEMKELPVLVTYTLMEDMYILVEGFFQVELETTPTSQPVTAFPLGGEGEGEEGDGFG